MHHPTLRYNGGGREGKGSEKERHGPQQQRPGDRHTDTQTDDAICTLGSQGTKLGSKGRKRTEKRKKKERKKKEKNLVRVDEMKRNGA